MRRKQNTKRKQQPTMTFEQWEYHLRLQLVHPDAIRCTATPDVIMAWWGLGYRPKRIADALNVRYSNGYLERKTKLEEAKTGKPNV